MSLARLFGSAQARAALQCMLTRGCRIDGAAGIMPQSDVYSDASRPRPWQSMRRGGASPAWHRPSSTTAPTANGTPASPGRLPWTPPARWSAEPVWDPLRACGPAERLQSLQSGTKHLRLDASTLHRITQHIAALPKTRIDAACTNGRRAAVMVPLCTVDGKVSVLFNVRSQHVTTHKGEVCFPGGHLDPSDECMEATANRECEEEVGVRVAAPPERALWEQQWKARPYYPRSNILGRLPNCVSYNGTLVTPVVGSLGTVNLANLVAGVNKAEIAEVFALSVEELLDGRGLVHESVDMGRGGGAARRMPAFGSGPHRVWGLTALILHHFLVEVMAPSILAGPAALRAEIRWWSRRERQKSARAQSGKQHLRRGAAGASSHAASQAHVRGAR